MIFFTKENDGKRKRFISDSVGEKYMTPEQFYDT